MQLEAALHLAHELLRVLVPQAVDRLPPRDVLPAVADHLGVDAQKAERERIRQKRVHCCACVCVSSAAIHVSPKGRGGHGDRVYPYIYLYDILYNDKDNDLYSSGKERVQLLDDDSPKVSNRGRSDHPVVCVS